MTAQEIRRGFLRFFERHGHRIVPSSPLVPANDPTLLFTNAGMNQFKDVFLGKERREYRRAASAQKCMRVSGKHNDLDNVGPSLRHHTFFEMLGNFSFGDYFKAEAIPFAWELLTKEWQLPPDRLWATIFAGEGEIPRDREAYDIWRKFLPAERIAELGLEENFWSMADTGPCGRCSEIHYFRGADMPCSAPVCLGVACSCDRFVEIWNNVFMEFDRQQDGRLAPLPAPSIDTGMGLERITAVLQGTLSNYDTDLFQPLIARISEVTGRPYRRLPDDEGDVSSRVIADHMRATTFLIADGVAPSNESRGYVLRKIMRRAMRHGKRLSMTEPFLHQLVDVIVKEMGDDYPELKSGRDSIVQLVRTEEERFDAVLTAGLPRLETALATATAGVRVLPGAEVFRLYDTFGLPLDFIEDLASERHISLDRSGYDEALEAQRVRARAAGTFGRRAESDASEVTGDATRFAEVPDVFEGYATTVVRGVPVLALFDEQRKEVEELGEGQKGYAILERSPFYVEAGGQISDVGRIFSEARPGEARVEGMTRFTPGGPRVHMIRVESGRLPRRAIVTAEVDVLVRDETRRNHTATHLLHAALRQLLGSHVKQAGSLVAPDRLRFDFVHFAPLTPEQIEQLERLVNQHVYGNAPVQTEVRPTQEAIAAGAMALFGEKYGDTVRVVSIPGFSVELCGGTHCRATGEIGLFVITQESGIAAGVRRIEAVTGASAVELYQRNRARLRDTLEMLKVPEDQAVDAIQRLQEENKRLARELSKLRVKEAAGRSRPSTGDVSAGTTEAVLPWVEIHGVRFLGESHRGLSKTELRHLADAKKAEIKSGVIVLASENDGKVAIAVSVTPDLASRFNAGQIVKEIAPIVGGGGGGRAEFAEAGGKDPSRIQALLDRSREVVAQMAEA